MALDPRQTHIVQEWQYTSPFLCCRFDPTGRFVFAGAEDRTVQRWEPATGQAVALIGHESWVARIAFLPDGQTMVTAGLDKYLIWWPTAAEKPEPLRKVKAHEGWVRTVAASHDGQWIASGGNDNLVKLWAAADGSLVQTLAGHDSVIYSTRFLPDGRFLLSGDLSGKVIQWDLQTGQAVRTFDASELHKFEEGQGVHYGGVRSIAVSPDGKVVACSGLYKAVNPLASINAPIVMLFDWETGQKVRSLIAADEVFGVIDDVLFHPEGFVIGASAAARGGSRDGYLFFWKTDTEREFASLKMPNSVRSVDLHPNGMDLATAHFDKHLRLSTMGPA